MALTNRLVAAVLAGVTLTGTMTDPALARWRAAGTGAGTVPTSAAAPRVITLTLTVAAGHTVKASGTAGSASPYNSTVSVVLCKENTWPCPAGKQLGNTLTATAGPSYTVTSANLGNNTAVYGQASQTQTSLWKDYSTVAGPVTS